LGGVLTEVNPRARRGGRRVAGQARHALPEKASQEPK